ncbi:MAG: sulfotransferase [Pseudomonadota bacterium]
MATTLTEAIELARQGNLAEARQLAGILLADSPLEAETHHFLGVLDNIEKRPLQAIVRFQQAIELEGGVAKYHSNLGNAQLAVGRVEAAEASYRQALALQPDFLPAGYNLAYQWFRADRPSEALALLGQFASCEDADTQALLARLHLRLNHPAEAIFHYHKALAVDGNQIDVIAELANLHETLNDIDAAQRRVDQGLAIDSGHAFLRVIQARLMRRRKEFEEAANRLSNMPYDRLDDRLAAGALNEWGLDLDALHRPGEAMEKFAAAKSRQARLYPDLPRHAAEYRAQLETTLRLDCRALHEQSVGNMEPTPVFLVGFPRSGTTLLEQILDSHPDIQALEEKPLIEALIAAHPEHFNQTGAALPLPAQTRQTLQSLYFDLAAQHLIHQPGKMWLDKYPLNLTRIHRILQIFPAARFILALRHPCDIMVSCQMHLFDLNPAMANFHSLHDSARLYALAMHLWAKFRDELQPCYWTVRYENLVRQRDDEIAALLDFLSLPWHDGTRCHTEHARTRGHINTPSYHQVVEPIHTRASGRWLRYRAELAPVFPLLAPAMDIAGYPVPTA